MSVHRRCPMMLRVSYIHGRFLPSMIFKRFVENSSPERKPIEKILKVAVIGAPNAGKSTLINSLVGRRVCSASCKVHTTRHNIRAISIEGSTQLVFLDTPGIVTSDEMRRHKLEKTFISSPETALFEADVIGVVHDVANKWTAAQLGERTLRLLTLHANKHSFLILNKIDVLKRKQKLFEYVDILTNKSLKESVMEDITGSDKLSEIAIKKSIEEQCGWSNFMEVFMVSALTGSGMGDVKEYLLQQAKDGPWIYKSDQFTDESAEDIVLQTVQSKLLEYLPKEIPYNIVPEMEYFNKQPDGRIVTVVLVSCPTPHVEKLVKGRKGKTIKLIAQDAEQDMRNTFHENVFLKLVITGKNNAMY